MESKTGIKTIDKLAEIPVVNTVVTNASDYYGKVKESNILLKTSLNLAELSFRTAGYAASPIATYWKAPLDSVDTYLSGQVDLIEHNYPVITKPTEQFTASFNEIREKTVGDLKNYGTSTVQTALTNGFESFKKSSESGLQAVDSLLENKFAKLFTDPFLDLTEKSLDYFLPQQAKPEGVQSEVAPTTLRRLYNINNRVYTQLQQVTVQRFGKLHSEFEAIITKLKSLNRLSETLLADSKQRVSETYETVSKNTLVAQCIDYAQKNNLSLNTLETYTRDYYKVIMTEASSLIEKYLSQVKNLPAAVNGAQVKQTIDGLISQVNKETLSNYLAISIELLTKVQQTLVSYSTQLMQAINNNNSASQLLKRIQSQVSLKANKSQTKVEEQESFSQLQNQSTPSTTTTKIPSANDNSTSIATASIEQQPITQTKDQNDLDNEDEKEEEEEEEEYEQDETIDTAATNTPVINEASSQNGYLHQKRLDELAAEQDKTAQVTPKKIIENEEEDEEDEEDDDDEDEEFEDQENVVDKQQTTPVSQPSSERFYSQSQSNSSYQSSP